MTGFAGVPGGQHRAVQPFSDEDASVETLSHCSSFSDAASVAEEGEFVYKSRHWFWVTVWLKHTSPKLKLWNVGSLAGGEAEVAAQDDFEFKLKVYIDSTVDKRFVCYTCWANDMHLFRNKICSSLSDCSP